MTEFKTRLDKWLHEVAEKCHELASNEKFDLDFYVFQSATQYNPKLMFIGANPGGNVSYSFKHSGGKRTKHELGEDENTFIKYYNDPAWAQLKPLYDMFSGNEQSKGYFKDAVITNVSYFNSGTFSVLRDKMRIVGKEPLNFCIQKNLELIEHIIQPQNIILMGAQARDTLLKYLDQPLEIILETSNNSLKKSVPLIKKSSITFASSDAPMKIPVYIIEHPSAWNGLNSKENVELKGLKFKEIFCSTLK